jgi:Cu/Ag efflux pump CusA
MGASLRVQFGYSWRRSRDNDAIVDGAAKRIRPKLMTVSTMTIGLVPVLRSSGTGVMQRITAPMIGGLVTSFLLELTVYPATFATWMRRVVARRSRIERRPAESVLADRDG